MTFQDFLSSVPAIEDEFFVAIRDDFRLIFRQVKSKTDREAVYSQARKLAESVKLGMDPLGGFTDADTETVFKAMIAWQLYIRAEHGDSVDTENSQRSWLEFATGPRWQVFENVMAAVEKVIAGTVTYGMVRAIEEAEKN